MKKRILFFSQIILLGLFCFSLVATILQFSGNSNPLTKFDHNTPDYNNIEAFDPSLSRLNSLEKLEQYCDSIYSEIVLTHPEVEFEKTYVEIVSDVVRKRFFHGYSYSDFNSNYVALLVSKSTVSGWAAFVEPADILKYPYAACSQQAIVMMETLKDKGFLTRKITFKETIYGGHFAFEVFYDSSWHFHDPNMEPDKNVLNIYGRPGIDFLTRNTDILLKAYSQHPKEKILTVFSNHSYGPVNVFPAPRAVIFLKITKFLSYTIWLFFLITFLVVRRKYLGVTRKMHVRTKQIPVPRMQPGSAPVYYPDYKAQQGA